MSESDLFVEPSSSFHFWAIFSSAAAFAGKPVSGSNMLLGVLNELLVLGGLARAAAREANAAEVCFYIT